METIEQQRFMQMAVDLSQYCVDSNAGGPFGAIVVKDGNIVGSSRKCVYPDLDPNAHAEVIAIRDACRNLKTVDLTGCHIYSSSEPCPMCLAAIYWAQISAIYYCSSESDILNHGHIDKHLLNEMQKPKTHRSINSMQIPNVKGIKVVERDKIKQNQMNVYIPQSNE